jgi:hypothetical protein
MYLTHLETRIWRGTFHTLKDGFSGLQNFVVPLGHRINYYIWSTLNVMILQMERNECVRFGRHVDIEVSYKILRLDVLKMTPILHNLSCFEWRLL